MPTIDVGGDALHYTDKGTGAPVLFVHGSCGGGGQWKALAGGLEHDYRTICIDLFGAGRSEPWPIERVWTVEDDKRAIDRLLTEVDEPVHFVIHSGGGLFAYPSIKSHLEQIRSLTFFEPVYFHLLRQAGDPLFSEPEGMATRFRLAIEGGDRDRAMGNFVDVWAQKEGVWASMPEAVKDYMRLGSDRLYHEWLLPWVDEPSIEDLRALDLPVLLFKGSATIAAAHRVCEIVEQALPTCRSVNIEGAGHMSPFTHAKDALPLLKEHLASASRGH